MKADSAYVVALTEAGKLPRALTQVLPVVDAVKGLASLKASAEWPHRATHPKLELRDTNGNTLDPKTGEIPAPKPKPKPQKETPIANSDSTPS